MKNRLLLYDILVLLGYVFFFLFFYHQTGVLYSTYHWVDDHVILEIDKLLSTYSYFEVVSSLIESDFSIRFRPVYHIVITTKVFLLGDNILNWNMVNLVSLIVCSFLIYKVMILNGVGKFLSIVAGVFHFLGDQAFNFFRTSTAENPGFIFLIAGMFFMGLSLKKEGLKKTMYVTLYVFFIILSSLTKESFLILIPSLIFWHLWLLKLNSNLSITQLVKKNLLPQLILTFFLLSTLFLIFFYVGLGGTGYAGVSISQMLGFSLLKSIWQFLVKQQLFWISLIIIGVSYITLEILSKDNELGWWHGLTKKIIPIFILTGLFIGSQSVIYLKSGIVERYYYPIAFIFIFLFVLSADFLIKIVSNYKRSKSAKVLISLIILFVFYFNFRNTFAAGARYYNSGKIIEDYLNRIELNIKKNSTILIFADPVLDFEWAMSLKRILKYKYDYNNIIISSFMTYDEGYTTLSDSPQFYEHLNSKFKSLLLDDYKENEDIKCDDFNYLLFREIHFNLEQVNTIINCNIPEKQFIEIGD